MSFHLVLDHSALIPCGDKPDEEKEAIRRLCDVLLECDVLWHVSKSYLMTLRVVGLRSLKHCHPLPRLLSSLKRVLDTRSLIEYANKESSWCRCTTLTDRFRLHVVARSAINHVEHEFRRELERFKREKNLTDEDLEVIAIAIASRGYASSICVVTTDTLLLDAVTQIIQQAELNLVAKTPRQLVQEILRETSIEPTDA